MEKFQISIHDRCGGILHMTDVKKSEIYPVFGCEICFVAIYAMFCIICFVAIINNGGDDVPI